MSERAAAAVNMINGCFIQEKLLTEFQCPTVDVLTKKEWKDKAKLIEYIFVAFGTFHLYSKLINNHYKLQVCDLARLLDRLKVHFGWTFN